MYYVCMSIIYNTHIYNINGLIVLTFKQHFYVTADQRGANFK